MTRSSAGPVFVGRTEFGDLLGSLATDVRRIHDEMIARRRARGDDARYGVDVEFKIMSGSAGPELFIKQARLLSAPVPE